MPIKAKCVDFVPEESDDLIFDGATVPRGTERKMRFSKRALVARAKGSP